MAEPCSAILPGCAREFGTIQAQILDGAKQREAMHADIKAIRVAVLGNGDPGKSLASRVSAIEASKATVFLVIAAAAAIAAVIVAIAK